MVIIVKYKLPSIGINYKKTTTFISLFSIQTYQKKKEDKNNKLIN